MDLIIKIFKIIAFIPFIYGLSLIFNGLKNLYYKIRKESCRADTLDTSEISSGAKVLIILIAIGSLLVSLIDNSIFYHFIGNGDIKNKPDGQYCYLIELTNEKGKTYRLPAEIHITNNIDDDEHNKRYYQTYYIGKAYWSNGGYLEFDNEIFLDYEITDISHNSKEEYSYKLLNEKATHPKIQETTPSTKSVVFYVLENSVILYAISCFTYYSIKQKD